MVPSTGVQPIYGSQRQYADMQNEIVNKLINLSQHHAMVRLPHDECTIVTQPLPAPRTDVDVERIRELSRARYYRRRDDVEQEIRKRQRLPPDEGTQRKPDNEPPPPPPLPPDRSDRLVDF